MQEAFDTQFAGYTAYVVQLWLRYIRVPEPKFYQAFQDAQSLLYLAQVYGLEGNFARAIALLPLPADPPTASPLLPSPPYGPASRLY